jgi:hypothetical protein
LPHARDESRKGVCVVSERGNYLSFTLAFALTKIHARSLFVSDIKIMIGFNPTHKEGAYTYFGEGKCKRKVKRVATSS